MDKNMFLNLGENKVSVKQTSSGYWYVNELAVSCLSVIDGLVLVDRAIAETEKILEKYNAKTDSVPAGKSKN